MQYGSKKVNKTTAAVATHLKEAEEIIRFRLREKS
jgi:hypothetical protein